MESLVPPEGINSSFLFGNLYKLGSAGKRLDQMLYFALTNHPEMVVYCFARAWKKGDPCSNPKYIRAAPHRNVAASRQADEPLGGDQLANFC